MLSSLLQVVMVACGGLHSAVCTAGQLAFCFGFNRYGQCGQGSCSNKVSAPRPVNMNCIGEPCLLPIPAATVCEG
jgi:alpha-tubulin suppressor-like RCC1 family protein